MKHMVAGLTIFSLILPSFAAAEITCRDRGEECSLGELLEISKNADAHNISKSEHIAIMLEIITHLRRIITNFSATSQVMYCVNLKHDLRPGATDFKTDGEVSTLQFFLTSQRVYGGLVTGYYGQQTARAVYEWQREQGIPEVDEKTGVGKITRKKIKETTCASLES